MQPRMKTIARLCFMVVVLLAGVSRDARACVCIRMPDTCSRIEAGDALMVATVDRIESRTPLKPNVMLPHERVVYLRDIEALVGTPTDVVLTGMGGGDCGYEFQVGERYLIDGSRFKQDGTVWAAICSRTQPIADAAQVRAYLESRTRPSTGARLWGRLAAANSYRERPGAREPQPQWVKGGLVIIDGPVRQTATTDAEGRFGVDGLPSGAYTIRGELSDDATGLARVVPLAVTLGAEPYACETVELSTVFATRIQGTVIEPAGDRLPPVLVSLEEADDPSPLGGVSTLVDAEGRYAFDDVYPGRYVVSVSLSNGPSDITPFPVIYARDAAGNIELLVPETPTTLELQPLSGHRLSPMPITGRVRWANGLPVIGVDVFGTAQSARGVVGRLRSVTTDANGAFELRDTYGGARYQLELRIDGRVVHRVDVTAGSAPIAIVLPQP